MSEEKDVAWCGSSLEDLKAFPEAAKKEAGRQLSKVQAGMEPDHWKPFDVVGSGVKEVRIHVEAGAFRVMYVAKFADAIYVLHCFQKKTQATAKQDVEIARRRYAALMEQRKGKR